MATTNLMTIYTTCPFCRAEHEVCVKVKDFEAWKNGELVQNAFPYLSPDTRELLITGICPDCWEAMFNPDE